MSFDYFNNSMLAFGNKLTRAFKTLEKLEKEASANIEQVIKDQEIFSEYVNRNYQVARPTRDESPVRSDELFDLLNDKEVYIRTLEYKDSKLNLNLIIFNRSNNRITRLSGSTTKKEGFVYFNSSISNQKPDGSLEFESEARLTEANLLFQYRIDSLGNINLIGDTSRLNIIPYDTSQYTSLSKGSTLATSNSKYTAKDYEVVCIVGATNKLMVYLNGKWIFGNNQSMGHGSFRHCILYLKPNDVITGTYNKIFRINYNK